MAWRDYFCSCLFTSAAFISLVQLGAAPAWMVALIIGREIGITGLRSLAQSKGITMPASYLGKIKMATQVTAVLLIIMGQGPFPLLEPVGYVALWIVLLIAVWSAIDYYRQFLVLTSNQIEGLDSTINMGEKK